MPLMPGSEISRSKVEAVKAHLETCPRCRREYDIFVLSFEKAKEMLAAERKDWGEKDWQQAIQKAVKEGKPGVSPLAPWPFKKVWAYALMAVFLIVLSLVVISPYFFKPAPESQMLAEAEPVKDYQQDIISMTLVSKETGLKIIWFFDKNFDLKEAEK